MADAPEDNAPVTTNPPKVQEGTGIALVGEYPFNHRLRAEALVKDGKTSDPDSVIDDALISATAERLAAEEAAERKQEAVEQPNDPPADEGHETEQGA